MCNGQPKTEGLTFGTGQETLLVLGLGPLPLSIARVSPWRCWIIFDALWLIYIPPVSITPSKYSYQDSYYRCYYILTIS
jgi:hypothetical protein